MNSKNYISFAKKSADIQINELKKIKKIFNRSFISALELIMKCKGKVIFSGVGKNSFICKKAAATFSLLSGLPSTDTKSIFVLLFKNDTSATTALKKSIKQAMWRATRNVQDDVIGMAFNKGETKDG